MNDMMLIPLYCIIDDFIKALMNTNLGQKMILSWNASRGPQRQLSLSGVLALNVLRFSFHIFDLKAFVRLTACSYKAYFPGLPNYENFLKASNRPFPSTVLLLQYLLELNRRMSAGALFFFDSTALSVCADGNISTHRAAEGFSSRGMTSKGWFYGFKLHGVCDGQGNPVNLRFTTGSVHDSREAANPADGLNGLVICRRCGIFAEARSI